MYKMYLKLELIDLCFEFCKFLYKSKKLLNFEKNFNYITFFQYIHSYIKKCLYNFDVIFFSPNTLIYCIQNKEKYQIISLMNYSGTVYIVNHYKCNSSFLDILNL